jgi:hypothetical protein
MTTMPAEATQTSHSTRQSYICCSYSGYSVSRLGQGSLRSSRHPCSLAYCDHIGNQKQSCYLCTKRSCILHQTYDLLSKSKLVPSKPLGFSAFDYSLVLLTPRLYMHSRGRVWILRLRLQQTTLWAYDSSAVHTTSVRHSVSADLDWYRAIRVGTSPVRLTAATHRTAQIRLREGI